MTTQEQINALQSRQLELKALMASVDYVAQKISDAKYLHSDRAASNLAAEYRDKLEEREQWRTEYNNNEEMLEELRTLQHEEEAGDEE